MLINFPHLWYILAFKAILERNENSENDKKSINTYHTYIYSHHLATCMRSATTTKTLLLNLLHTHKIICVIKRICVNIYLFIYWCMHKGYQQRCH